MTKANANNRLIALFIYVFNTELSYNHRLTYSHSRGFPNEFIRIRTRMDEKCSLKKKKKKKRFHTF